MVRWVRRSFPATHSRCGERISRCWWSPSATAPSSRACGASWDGEDSASATRRSVLTELRIRNFAIIGALTLPLAAGFNVLTGETGAGKSIIVGALGFLLGERGTADLIRTGADKASVEGIFDVSGDAELI